MERKEVERALIDYLRSYPNFLELTREQQWEISIEKRKEIVQLANEGKLVSQVVQKWQS